ncbi:MAG: NAD/NADP octopine/nopaline dehydrogenase family protein [Promethearchaeota archaeon]
MQIKNNKKITIIGAGNGGRAFSVYLANKGFQVNLCFHTFENIKKIYQTHQIYSEGVISGTYQVKSVSNKYKPVIENTDLIFLVVPASIHRNLISKIIPYLKDGQIIILNPGRTWGAIEVYNLIKKRRPYLKIFVAETQTLLFTCRKLGDFGVLIKKIKNSVKYCFYAEIPPYKDLIFIHHLIPEWKLIHDIRITSLNNIGAVIHPAITLLNAGSISREGNFEFYREGLTSKIAKIVEKVDKERCSIIKAMGIKPITLLQWVKQVYGIETHSIHNALHRIESYHSIMAPQELYVRYLTEDIPTGLVPFSSIGKYIGISTPIIDSLITIAEALLETKFRKNGRTIQNVGLPISLLNQNIQILKEKPLRFLKSKISKPIYSNSRIQVNYSSTNFE